MRISFRILILLMAIGITMFGCGSAPARESANQGGGTLTRAMTDEPIGLDPQGAANSGTNLVLPYIFDTLIARQRDGKYAGLLAESWQASSDGLNVDFKLKQGVKFHDGTNLTTGDVVFTFERFKRLGDKSPIAADIKQISGVQALDESTVRFTFAKPTATFLGTLSAPYAAILSAKAVQAAGDKIDDKPVGTGPLKLGEWKRGTSITLVRNPDYQWGKAEAKNRGPVRIDRLVYKLIPDASTQLAALQSGDIDVMFLSEPSQLEKIKNDKNLVAEQFNLDSLIYLGYNAAKSPFDDVRVRQALSFAVNKGDIVKTALSGLGAEAYLPLTPSMIGYNLALKSYGQGFDLVKAKSLLAEAGFAQGTDGSWQRNGNKLAAKLLISNRAPNEAVATVLQSQFKVLGVPVEIQQLDSAAVMKTTTEGAFDILLWRYDWWDPDALNTYLGSSRIRQTNRVFYSNPKVDALLQQGAQELDLKTRAGIYEEAQKLILADAPWQPLYNPSEALVYRSRVKGVVISSLGEMLVNDVTLSEK